MAPPDAIMGLTEAFRNDTNPGKINLSVGVYKDSQGETPVLECVKKAEARLVEQQGSKVYLPIDGAQDYAAAVQELVFGPKHEVMQSKRAVTAHTPGGTGALRVTADFIARLFSGATVWLSAPTWANHGNIFGAAGVSTDSYPYYDAGGKQLDFDAMMAALKGLGPKDVVLFHACCHNPTGMDPSAEQWEQLAGCAAERGWVPLFDFAYHGFGDGLEKDAAGVRAFMRPGCEAFICTSYSKNFSLYNERVGALTVVGESEDAAKVAQSHVKKCIRANYSNPPAHGAQVVTTVLNDADLRAEWEGEVAAMRNRIHEMRQLFADTLKAKGVERDFSFLTRQRGMFSFSGLNKEQVETLREKYSIYIVGSGRINVAGMTPSNMDRLCQAIAEVL